MSPSRSGVRRYRGALATGVDEVLESYRAAILGLEQDLLSGPLPLSFSTLFSSELLSLLAPRPHSPARPASSSSAGAVAPSPSAIAAALIPFSLGFPAMAALVADLRRRPVGGGQLLVMLHERTRGAGGSERQRLFERLLWHCYQARRRTCRVVRFHPPVHNSTRNPHIIHRSFMHVADDSLNR